MFADVNTIQKDACQHKSCRGLSTWTVQWAAWQQLYLMNVEKTRRLIKQSLDIWSLVQWGNSCLYTPAPLESSVDISLKISTSLRKGMSRKVCSSEVFSKKRLLARSATLENQSEILLEIHVSLHHWVLTYRKFCSTKVWNKYYWHACKST